MGELDYYFYDNPVSVPATSKIDVSRLPRDFQVAYKSRQFKSYVAKNEMLGLMTNTENSKSKKHDLHKILANSSFDNIKAAASTILQDLAQQLAKIENSKIMFPENLLNELAKNYHSLISEVKQDLKHPAKRILKSAPAEIAKKKEVMSKEKESTCGTISTMSNKLRNSMKTTLLSKRGTVNYSVSQIQFQLSNSNFFDKGWVRLDDRGVENVLKNKLIRLNNELQRRITNLGQSGDSRNVKYHQFPSDHPSTYLKNMNKWEFHLSPDTFQCDCDDGSVTIFHKSGKVASLKSQYSQSLCVFAHDNLSPLLCLAEKGHKCVIFYPNGKTRAILAGNYIVLFDETGIFTEFVRPNGYDFPAIKSFWLTSNISLRITQNGLIMVDFNFGSGKESKMAIQQNKTFQNPDIDFSNMGQSILARSIEQKANALTNNWMKFYRLFLQLKFAKNNKIGRAKSSFMTRAQTVHPDIEKPFKLIKNSQRGVASAHVSRLVRGPTRQNTRPLTVSYKAKANREINYEAIKNSICPQEIRTFLLRDEYYPCHCLPSKLPILTDIEFDTFINNVKSKNQFICILVLSSIEMCSHLYKMFLAIHMERFTERASSLVKSETICRRSERHPFRLLFYPSDQNSLLYNRNHVVSGNIMIYQSGRIIWCSQQTENKYETIKDFWNRMQELMTSPSCIPIPADFKF